MRWDEKNKIKRNTHWRKFVQTSNNNEAKGETVTKQPTQLSCYPYRKMKRITIFGDGKSWWRTFRVNLCQTSGTICLTLYAPAFAYGDNENTNDFQCCQHIFRPARRYTPFVAKQTVHIFRCSFMVAASGYCFVRFDKSARAQNPCTEMENFDGGLTVRLTVEDSFAFCFFFFLFLPFSSKSTHNTM